MEKKLYGVFDASYSRIGAVEEPEADESSTDQNPFTSDSGIMRLNLSIEKMLEATNTFGLTAGVGFTTRADTEDQTRASLAERYFGGIVFLADFGKSESQDRATGRVLLGYAADDFWEWTVTSQDGSTAHRREHDRWFLDARLDAPGFFQNKDVRLPLRLFADGPTSGDGPSDLRVSLLISTDIGSIFGLTGAR